MLSAGCLEETVKSPVNKNYLAGQYLQSKKQFEHTDPVDGSIVTMVAEAGREMVDNAAQAGREALQDEQGAFSAADTRQASACASRWHAVSQALVAGTVEH